MHLSHEEYVANQRMKVVNIASDVIEGKRSILLAAQQITQLRFEIDLNEDNEDLLVFVAIDSECDSLPIGPDKEYWDKDSLKKKEKEIKETEEWALSIGTNACNNLIARFSKKNTST